MLETVYHYAKIELLVFHSNYCNYLTVQLNELVENFINIVSYKYI